MFERLFTPIKIGSTTLKNRIVLMPHGVTFMAGYGDIAERSADYHVERAKGGVGMIVMTNYLMPESWKRYASWGGNLVNTPLGGLDVASDEALIPRYKVLTERIHEHGARFLAQLNLGGRQLPSPGLVQYGLPYYAPSSLPCPQARQIPKEMDRADIREVVESHAIASENLKTAGVDGVELFAAQGYLISEFLSPHTNWRQDEYGGSLENRARILTESVQAVRRAVGRDFVVGVRLNGDDYVPDGFTLPMALELVRLLQGTGLVDYLNVSGMTYSDFPAWIADTSAADAPFVDLSRAIRKAAPELPVCVGTLVRTPGAAEKILRDGDADVVGMVRALIADPELPNKARRGDLDDIRKCTYTNQSCLMGLSQGRGLSCMQNMAVGKEGQIGIGKMRPAKARKNVVVVGGGPAGMAAARIAHERGHAVILFEQDGALGGQNNLAAAIESRKSLAEITRWQEHELRKTSVQLRLGAPATLQRILQEGPDAVIVATGSTPKKTGYTSLRPEVRVLPGASQDNVFTVWGALRDSARLGDEVVLIDEDPHLSGAHVAGHLAKQGRKVTVLTSHFHVSSSLHLFHVPDLYRRLAAAGVRIVENSLPISISGRELLAASRYSSDRTWTQTADSFVLAMGNEPQNALYGELSGKVPETVCIGDALAPRKIDDAILDGERAGWMI